MKTPEELTDLFHQTGRRITAQRQCVFRILEHNETHPSADQIYVEAMKRLGTVSLKTIYQTLNDLTELGEISLLQLGTGQARFDPNIEAVHHHLVCRMCGTIIDLHVDIDSPKLPPNANHGFDVERAEIVFKGVCPDCKNKKTRRNNITKTHEGKRPRKKLSKTTKFQIN
ncbi:MAG: transcriptional repressor [Actinobacteria bacterium]|jgi:Fe2+ or Zn2+ uptake regulation protein|nr:transcriptional repressor [Actinomycetota bacterium]MCL6104417.1 transcriptional repressor [Actinomycetota bacterium]